MRASSCATLTNANFSQANLTNANFIGATLTGANFTGAEVRGAALRTRASHCPTLLDGQLPGPRFDRNGCPATISGVNLAGQNLTNANFTPR